MNCDNCIHNDVCYSVAECLIYIPGFTCDNYEPQRPTGEWIDEYWENAYQEFYHTCSICKKKMRTTCYDKYCTNCGAKMKEAENG